MIRVVIGLSLAMLPLGCARGPFVEESSHRTPRERFLNALTLGRSIHNGVGKPSTPGLGLADAIVDATEVMDAPTWVRFDTAMMPLVNQADLLSFSEKYISEGFGAWLDVKKDLTLEEDAPRKLHDNLYMVSFTRSFGGVPVRDARIDLYFSKREDGRLALSELSSRHAGRIALANEAAGSLDESQVAKLIDKSELHHVNSQPVIMAARQSDGRLRYVRATEMRFAQAVTGEAIVATTENGAETVLEAYSNQHSLAKGKILARVFERSWTTPAVPLPFAFAAVQSATGSETSGAAGELDGELSGSVTIMLDNPRAQVRQGGGAWSLRVAGGGATTTFEPKDADLRATNAYLTVQRANTFVRRHLTPEQAPILSGPIGITVDRTDGVCNAFYTEKTINFFAEGNCPDRTRGANTALVNDVVAHEWGHGLDDVVGRSRSPGITDGAFSEGIGDVVAAYMSGDPAMGSGFKTASPAPVRHLENTAHYPEGRGEVHNEGLIVGGLFWDLRKALIERYGPVKGAYDAEELFFKHLLDTDTYTESYQSVLRIDDDDGNPATQSPNFCLITKVFANRGLTPAKPCDDDQTKLLTKADPQITASVWNDGKGDAGGLSFMAAAPLAVNGMKVCVGTARACRSLESGTWFDLYLEGKLETKKTFITKAPLTVGDGGYVTFATVDDAGALLGRRTLKLFTP